MRVGAYLFVAFGEETPRKDGQDVQDLDWADVEMMVRRTSHVVVVACKRRGKEGKSCFLGRMWKGWTVLDEREERTGALAALVEAGANLKMGSVTHWQRLKHPTADVDGHQFVWPSDEGNRRAG